MTRALEKQLGTVNILVALFRTKLETHDAEERCPHRDEVKRLRAGLEQQERRAVALRAEISELAEIGEPPC